MGVAPRVVDMHSFSNHDWKEDVVLLRIPEAPNELLRNLAADLKKEKISVRTINGAPENDIGIEAVKRGGDAVLVEVNEHGNVAKIGRAIGKFIERQELA
jgi:3-dehydroquinate synthase class II